MSDQIKNELDSAIILVSSASVDIGSLPERPGFNGSILQIDNNDATRIVSDLDSAAETIEKAKDLINQQALELASLRADAALGKVAMRFVDRAGDVHPGIDDAETICADFYKAMCTELEPIFAAQRQQSAQVDVIPTLPAFRWHV